MRVDFHYERIDHLINSSKLLASMESLEIHSGLELDTTHNCRQLLASIHTSVPPLLNQEA